MMELLGCNKPEPCGAHVPAMMEPGHRRPRCRARRGAVPVLCQLPARLSSKTSLNSNGLLNGDGLAACGGMPLHALNTRKVSELVFEVAGDVPVVVSLRTALRPLAATDMIWAPAGTNPVLAAGATTTSVAPTSA